MNYRPIGNFLMVTPAVVAGVTPGGIIIPDQAKPSLNEGVVTDMGHTVDPTLHHIGQTVVFGFNSEYKIKVGDKVIVVVDASNVYLTAD